MEVDGYGEVVNALATGGYRDTGALREGEAAGLAKSGGLADGSAGLPAALLPDSL